MKLNKTVISRALNATFGEKNITPFATNAGNFSGLSMGFRRDLTQNVDEMTDNIQDVIARTNQILDQGAPTLSYDRQRNVISTISNTGGKRTVKQQQYVADSAEDAKKNLHGFLMQHSSEYQQNVRFATAQRKQELSFKRRKFRQRKKNERIAEEGVFDFQTDEYHRQMQLMGAREKGQIKQQINADDRLAVKEAELSPAQRVQEFDAPINKKYQEGLGFLKSKSEEASAAGNSALERQINLGIKKFQAGEITDPEDVMRMNYYKEQALEPVRERSIMDRIMRRPGIEHNVHGPRRHTKHNVGEALGHEFKGPAPKQKSNGAINGVSSTNAGAGDVTPGDMGYAGFSSGFERHAAGAVIGAGMGMMSEGEVSVGGAARGAMFGVVGGKAARMFTGSMRGGAVNSMTRGVGDTLSAAGEGTMRQTAGQFINKSMSGFDGAKSQEAMRMATFAGAGLAGFSMGRDRNHSRGMNGSRGSRF